MKDKTVREVLKRIKSKNSVNKDDLRLILNLSGDEQMSIIKKISKTRQKKLLEYLEQTPYLDNDFNFPLSRRESFATGSVAANNTTSPQL